MSDDKNKIGEPDRSKVSASEPYEISYIASKFALSMDEARDLVAKHGPSREAVEAAAARLTKSARKTA
ncbi:MAG: DUF3606 domain-containing protein [Hyphomicrobiales bacterium]